ncbi:hypothetical protein HYS42_00245 [Candidatus Saccharibacteria bacterium]|nr:hypothetical protein [Candidatus Saccharibacteria bacterium]
MKEISEVEFRRRAGLGRKIVDEYDARKILTDFVAESEQTPEVQSYEELQGIVRPEVASALASLILQTGHPSKHPKSGNLAVLNTKQGRKMVQGVVKKGYESNEPVSIYLAELKRGLLRFKRKRWVMLSLDGLGYGSAVDTGDEFYIPSLHSEDTVRFYRDEIGERTTYSESGGPKTGLELAGVSIRERPQALSSFLRVTAELTKDLVRIETVAS